MQPPSLTLERLLGEAEGLRRVAFSVLRDAHGAEDVAQDAALIALERGPQDLDEGSFRGWISTVARNRALSRLRREQNREAREAAVARPESTSSAAGIEERLVAQRALAGALLDLSEQERELVVMRYFDDLPPRAIAERLNMSVTAVSSRLHRSLKKLRAGTVSSGVHAPGLALVAGAPARSLAVGTGMAASLGWILAVACVALLATSAALLLVDPESPAGIPEVVEPVETTMVPVRGGDADLEVTAALEPVALEGDQREPVARAKTAVVSESKGTAPSSEPERQLILRVRVLDPDGMPISGASVGPVKLPPTPPRFSFDPRYVAKTDALGEARLLLPWEPSDSSRPSQSCSVLVTAAGWTESLERQSFKEPGEFTLEDVQLQRTGTVIGRVVDADGQPVPHATVGVVAPTLPGSPETERQRREAGQAFLRHRHAVQGVLTGQDGTYRLELAPIGRLSMLAHHGPGDYTYGAPLEVREGETQTADDLVFAKAPKEEAIEVIQPDSSQREMTLHLASTAGEPLEGLSVVCLDAAKRRPLRQQPVRRSDGVFFLQCPSEPFCIMATASRHEPMVKGPFEPASARKYMRLALIRSIMLRGRVIDGATGEGVAGAKVHAHAPTSEGSHMRFRTGLLTAWHFDRRVPRTAETDSAGRFSLLLPGKGKRLVHVERDGFALAEFGPVLAETVDGLPEVLIELAQGATLGGQVKLAKGVDPTTFVIVASRADGHILTADVNADGSYGFAQLAPGPLQLRRKRGSAVEIERSNDSLSRVGGGAAYPTYQVTIPREGHITFDFDYQHEFPVDVELDVSLDGAWDPEWIASLALKCEKRYGSTESVYMEEPLPADGRLSMHASGSSDAHLTLRRLTPSYGQQSLSYSWDPRPGQTRLSWSAVTGSLNVQSLPVVKGLINEMSPTGQSGLPGFALVHKGADGWRWIERFESTAEGTQTFPQVPTGWVEVRQRRDVRHYDPRDWHLLGEVEIRRGEPATLVVEETD